MEILTTALVLLGAAAVTFGVQMWSVPAAFIIAGIFLIGFAVEIAIEDRPKADG